MDSSKKANSKVLKFLKRTLSFSDASGGAGDIPRGCLAVCVGEEMQRFVIPTEYLSHRAFGALLREAEEEFGFEQEGVLRIPCEVSVFESILKRVEKNVNCKREIYY
ncbi:auxin-induced protein 6B-like [Canna indica]|uniref:Auxin-induced protein 6B-like n=1 Tax=Canna indica TaxID=4628 RepID=A0AAQ3KU89_9LILI|nr:auxin-induced protein 6B-like [Canna indica]